MCALLLCSGVIAHPTMVMVYHWAIKATILITNAAKKLQVGLWELRCYTMTHQCIQTYLLYIETSQYIDKSHLYMSCWTFCCKFSLLILYTLTYLLFYFSWLSYWASCLSDEMGKQEWHSIGASQSSATLLLNNALSTFLWPISLKDKLSSQD